MKRKRGRTRVQQDEPVYFRLRVIRFSANFSFSINDRRFKPLEHVPVFETLAVHFETVITEPERFRGRSLLVRVYGDREMAKDLMATPFVDWRRTQIGMLNIRGKKPAEAWCYVPLDEMPFVLSLAHSEKVNEISLRVASLHQGSGVITSLDLGCDDANASTLEQAEE